MNNIRFQGITYLHGPKDKVEAEREKWEEKAQSPSRVYGLDIDNPEQETWVLMDGEDCLAFYEDFGIDTKAPGIFLGRIVKKAMDEVFEKLKEEGKLPADHQKANLDPETERSHDLQFEYFERRLEDPDAAEAHTKEYLARYRHTDISGKPVLHVIV